MHTSTVCTLPGCAEGERKGRAEEEVRVSQQATPIGIVAHCARLRSAPHNLFNRPAREIPHVPVQKLPVGPATSRDECVAGAGIFSAGLQAGSDGEGNGGREKTRG